MADIQQIIIGIIIACVLPNIIRNALASIMKNIHHTIIEQLLSVTVFMNNNDDVKKLG